MFLFEETLRYAVTKLRLTAYDSDTCGYNHLGKIICEKFDARREFRKRCHNQ